MGKTKKYIPSMISTFVYFLTAITKFLFLEERLDAKLSLYPNFIFQKFSNFLKS